MAVPRDLSEAAALFGLPPDAAQDLVGERYRQLAQIYHPDRNPDAPQADARMQELNVARELFLLQRDATLVVSDPRETHESTSSPEERRLATLMHEMPYGVYFIGSVREGEPSAMIADWVMQVSFRPRLLAVAFEQDSYSLASIIKNRALTVSLLSERCFDIVGRFLQPRDPSKIGGRSRHNELHDKLHGADYWTTESGCPVLDDALTWLDCEAQQFLPVGDHVLTVAQVLTGGRQEEGEPLTSLNTGWNYSG